MKVSELMPESIKSHLRAARKFIRGLDYVGNARYCPVCNRHSKKFGVVGSPPRDDAQCFYCGAYERHRMVWLYFKRKTDFFASKSFKMLHVAPEATFEKLFHRQLGNNYLTADLFNPRAMVKMDITDIQYPDDSFDVIYCSHVLEHVPDDRKAMREFFRVLKPSGWAMLLVPIVGEQTFEDPSITDPAERARVFGQDDHVRIYGRDYVGRLREAGFKVDVIYPEDFLSKEEIEHMGITKAAGEIFFCKKPGQSATF